MSPIAFAIAVPAAFVAGVVFSKHVLSEAASIKQHVSSEVAKLRAELQAVVQDAAKKL